MFGADGCADPAAGGDGDSRLLLCGSLQARSANRAALDVAGAYLTELDGVEVEIAEELAAIPNFNPDVEAGSAITALRARIGRCDVAMIATPEYAGGIAGSLKNALDWIVGSGEFYRKPVAVVSAGTTGGINARRQLIQTLTWQGAQVVAELGIAAPKTKSDAHGRITDPATISAIEGLADLASRAPSLPPNTLSALVKAIATGAGIDAQGIAPANSRAAPKP